MVGYKVNYDIREEKIYSIRNYWSWMNFFVTLIGILLIFSIIRTSVFMCVQVSGRSMNPTVVNGDYLLVDKTSSVRRGDVIVFYSRSLDKLLIKRVVGLPGDTVRTINGDVYLKKSGEEVYKKSDDGYLSDEIKHNTWKTAYAKNYDLEPYVVEDGRLFVMGDNRTDSLDSRVLGAIPFNDVKGVVSQFIIDNRYGLQFLYRMF